MDFDKLIEEITKKVLEKIDGQELGCDSKAEDKPKLLVVSENYNDSVYCLLKNGKVGKRYHIDWACECNGELCSDDYGIMVLLDLTCDTMGKIAAGIADSKCTRLVSQAILSGKRICVPKREIQLFRYKDTAPIAYYGMMLQKLNMLAEYGVLFCDSDKLEDEILKKTTAVSMAVKVEAERLTEGVKTKKQVELDKKVVTERDVRAALADGAAGILVKTGTIITDLALEFASDCGLYIENL